MFAVFAHSLESEGSLSIGHSWSIAGEALFIGGPAKRTGDPRSFVTEREAGVAEGSSLPRKRASLVVDGGLECEANWVA